MSHWQQRMTEDLQRRGLSERTQTAYLRAIRRLADHAAAMREDISERQVREYLLHLKNVREFAPAAAATPAALSLFPADVHPAQRVATTSQVAESRA